MANPTHQPLRFEPHFRSMVWGGRRLGRFLGKNLPGPGPFGESWEVSDHPSHNSLLATASNFGVGLRQLMLLHRRELLGPPADDFDRFPWLIKLLDACDNLSVQVHPDEDVVKKLNPGESAKTEAWLILDAEPNSRIYSGLKPGVGPAEFRKALTAGQVVDCLYSFVPSPGDFVFLPAGTVHALGGGILLAEIQQTSDATFRLFDWNRPGPDGKPRALHIEESLACIHWDQGPVEPISAFAARAVLNACPYFEIARLEAGKKIALGGRNQLQALIVKAGQGRFDNGEFVMPGDVWILPAAMPAINLTLDLPLAGLLCTLPITR
jgi:mannose-6-phosphate isomerase